MQRLAYVVRSQLERGLPFSPRVVLAVASAVLASISAELVAAPRASAESVAGKGSRAVAAVVAGPECSQVTLWNIVLVNQPGYDYFFVKKGGGWVASYVKSGLDPFGTVDLSVSGSSFHALNSYLGGYSKYKATFDGTLSAECSIGNGATSAGTWTSTSNQRGLFDAYPIDLTQTAGFTLSGTVTESQPGQASKPLANVGVVATGRSGRGRATTGADGMFVMRLRRGIYTVVPLGTSLRFTPSSHEVDLVANVLGVNFGAAPSCGGATTGVSSVASSPCPLKVFVRTLETLRSGLGLNDDYPVGGPVNFTTPVSPHDSSGLFTAPGTPGQRCRSGCINVLVGVVDPATHANLANATVEATIEPIVGFQNHGYGLLCLPVPYKPLRCGSTLTGLKTDKDGKLRLLYWTPGEIVPVSTQLRVTATSPPCATASCPLPATEETTLTVVPYPIYTVEDTEIEPAEMESLVELWRHGWIGFLTEGAKHVAEEGATATLISAAREWFVSQSKQAIVEAGRTGEYAAQLGKQVEHIAESAAERSELLVSRAGILAALATQSGEAYTVYNEQIQLMVLFLSALKLNTLGLGVERDQTDIPFLTPAFESLILARTWIPSAAASGGVMWSLAHALSGVYGKDPNISAPIHLSLQVYEVSYCDKGALDTGQGVCGPGYYFSRAIDPMLAFVFSVPSLNWKDSFTVPYNPPLWVPGQVNIKPNPA